LLFGPYAIKKFLDIVTIITLINLGPLHYDYDCGFAFAIT